MHLLCECCPLKLHLAPRSSHPDPSSPASASVAACVSLFFVGGFRVANGESCSVVVSNSTSRRCSRRQNASHSAIGPAGGPYAGVRIRGCSETNIRPAEDAKAASGRGGRWHRQISGEMSHARHITFCSAASARRQRALQRSPHRLIPPNHLNSHRHRGLWSTPAHALVVALQSPSVTPPPWDCLHSRTHTSWAASLFFH